MEQPLLVLFPIFGWTVVVATALAWMVMRFKETPYIASRCVVQLANITFATYVAMAIANIIIAAGVMFPNFAGRFVYYSGFLVGLAIVILLLAILAIYYAQSAAKAKKAAQKTAGSAAANAAQADPTKTLEDLLAKAMSGKVTEKEIIEALEKFDPEGKGDLGKLWDWLKGNQIDGMACKIGRKLLPQLEDMKNTGKASGQSLSKEDLDEVKKMIDFIKEHCPEEKEKGPEPGDDNH